MYRPTLRRKLPRDQSSPLQPILHTHEKKNITQPSHKNHFHNFSIPTKIVQPPAHNKKEPVHLISPLLVQIHNYPQAVKTHLEGINAQDLNNRGIGVYKQINWFFKGKVVVVWLTDSNKFKQIQVEDEINCMAIGELRDRCLPAKLKRNYLMAIGCKENLSIYSVNPYTLESNFEGFKYRVRNFLQLSKIKFICDNHLLVSGCTRAIQLVSISNISHSKKCRFPFYQTFKAVNLSSNRINCKQMLYTPKRIFALYNEIVPKYWFVKIWDSTFGDDPSETYKKTYIVVYDIMPTYLQEFKRITAREIQKKIRSIIPQWNTKSEITSIYLDYTNDSEGQLGIVTNDGCFLVLKNNKQNYISKEPIFIPKISSLGQCEFLQEIKLEPLRSSNTQQNKIETQQVTNSLGYQNLSLIEEGLFWVGDQRIDGVLLKNPNIEIVDKNEQSHLNLVQQNRQWGLYTLANNYYTIRQQPLRSFVALLIYIKGSLNNEYEGYHYKEQKFSDFIDKQIKKLRPQRFLKYLIEILILNEKGISVNNFMMDMIDQQMKEEKPKYFKQWNHVLSSEIKKKEVLLTQDMFRYIWSLILVLQYKQTTPANIQDKSYSSTNVYWLAIHNIYYNIVCPLLGLDHLGFKSHKNQVQQAYLLLKSLQGFIQKKQLLENQIRNNLNIRTEIQKNYHDSPSTDYSRTAFVNDITNITNEAQNIVLSKVFNQKHSILEQKVKSAITSTVILISIYFNLQGLIQMNGFNISKLGINSFKDILISKESQKRLKSFIISRTSYDHLQDLKTKLPFFYIDQDLAFMRCINKIKLENRPKNEIDLKQLGSSINSEYFEEADKIFQNRMDLKFKMLEHYYNKIQAQTQKLSRDYTQYARNKARKQIFPNDEEQMLQYKRTFFQNQIEKIVNQQKRYIKRAVEIHNQQKQNKSYNFYMVMDQLIISISGSIVFLDYIQSELRNFNLLKQCNQVEKLKHRYFAGQKRGQIKDPLHREYIPRELFPNRKEF